MLSFSECGIFKLGTGCEWRLFSQILKLPGPLRVTTLMFYYFFAVSNFFSSVSVERRFQHVKVFDTG